MAASGESLTPEEAIELLSTPDIVDGLRRQPKTSHGETIAGLVEFMTTSGENTVDALRIAQGISKLPIITEPENR